MRSLQCFHIAEFYNYPIAPAHAYVHQFKNRFDAGKTTLTGDNPEHHNTKTYKQHQCR